MTKKIRDFIAQVFTAFALLGVVVSLQNCEGGASRKQLPLGNKFPFGMVELFGDTLLVVHPGSQINTIVTPSGAAFPLYDGALLSVMKGDSSSMLFYREGDGKKLELAFRPGQLWVNGKLHCITLDSSAATANWLRSYQPEALDGLRLVMIGENIPDSWYPRIFELVKSNPALSFFLENLGAPGAREEILLEGLWKATLPELFVGTDQQSVHADLRAARAVFLSKQDSIPAKGYVEALAKMPPGGRIWLDGFGEEEVARIVSTTSPEELALENTEVKNLKNILWPGLRSLSLTGPISDFSALEALNGLERLGVVIESGASGKNAIKNLSYLSISADSATAFALLRQNRNLQFLSLAVDTLRGIPDFREYGKLEGIVLAPLEVEDYRTFETWAIPYIGAPVKDSVLQLMRAKMPEAMVYGQGKDFWGACLGSGWLILLLPMVVLFTYGRKWLYGK